MEHLIHFLIRKFTAAEARPIFFAEGAGSPPDKPKTTPSETKDAGKKGTEKAVDKKDIEDSPASATDNKLAGLNVSLKQKKLKAEQGDKADETSGKTDKGADDKKEAPANKQPDGAKKEAADKKTKLTPEQQQGVDGLQKVGVDKDVAVAIVEGLKALADFLKSLNPNNPSGAKNEANAGDKAADKKTADKGAGEKTADAKIEKPAEALDPRKVQNPKAEAEKIGTTNIDALKKEKDDLMNKGPEKNAKNQIEPQAARDYADRVDALTKKIAEAEGKQKQKEDLNKEQDRRNMMVDDAWGKAAAAGLPEGDRAVQKVSLDGDKLTFAVKKDAPGAKQIADLLKQNGLTDFKENENSITVTVPPALFERADLNAAVQKGFEAVAKMPAKTAERKEDKNSGAEGKEAIDQKINALNAKVDRLNASVDKEVLTSTAIGRVLSKMKFQYNEKTKDIDIVDPVESIADIVSLAKAAGWKYNEAKKELSNGRGGSIDMNGGTFVSPSYYGFGGKPGDFESQNTAIGTSLDNWSTRLNKEVPKDTKELGKDGDTTKVIEKDTTGDYVSKLADSRFKTDVERIKTTMKDPMKKTVMGRAIQQIDFKQDADGSTVLVYKNGDNPNSAKEFAFIYRSTISGAEQEVGTSGANFYAKLSQGGDSAVESYLKKIEAMVCPPSADKAADKPAAGKSAEKKPETSDAPGKGPEKKESLSDKIEKGIGAVLDEGTLHGPDDAATQAALKQLNDFVKKAVKTSEGAGMIPLLLARSDSFTYNKDKHNLAYNADTFNISKAAAAPGKKPLEKPKDSDKNSKEKSAEPGKESKEVADDIFAQMKKNIIGVLAAKGLTDLAEKGLPDSKDIKEGKNTPEEFTMKYRELQKVASAKEDWAPIDGYGKTDGAKIYMYRLDKSNNRLEAFTPTGNYQTLNIKAGTFSGAWERPAIKPEQEQGLSKTYAAAMKNINTEKNVAEYKMNDKAEEYMKNKDVHKDSTAYTESKKANADAWKKPSNVELAAAIDAVRAKAAEKKA